MQGALAELGDTLYAQRRRSRVEEGKLDEQSFVVKVSLEGDKSK